MKIELSFPLNEILEYEERLIIEEYLNHSEKVVFNINEESTHLIISEYLEEEIEDENNSETKLDQ